MGFEIVRFVNCNGLDEFKCCICLDVLKEPMASRACEHMFCHECIMDWIERETNCPIDRTPLERTDLVEPGHFIRDRYEQLQIKCDFDEVIKNTISLILTFFQLIFRMGAKLLSH